MGYLGCSLVHLNANVVSALSSFAMLCECWLGIPPDTSLFWYYYSPARSSKTIFGGIGLSLRRKCRNQGEEEEHSLLMAHSVVLNPRPPASSTPPPRRAVHIHEQKVFVDLGSGEQQDRG
jgi:hypothetical protein